MNDKADDDTQGYWDDFLHRELEKESDRACVIVSASLLEEAIDSLLRNFLVAPPSREDDLLEGAYAPLGTLSAKIDACYRLGLVPVSVCRDLHLIRKIRNDFAHNFTGCSFDDANVRNRVLALSKSLAQAVHHPDTRQWFSPGVKGDFHMVVGWLLWFLWGQAKCVVRTSSFPEFVPRAKEK